MTNAHIASLNQIALAYAARTDGPFERAQVLQDDGLAALRLPDRDDLRVRLRHRKSRHRVNRVDFAPDADPAALAQGIEAAAMRLAGGVRYMLHVEVFQSDPDKKKSPWYVAW